MMQQIKKLVKSVLRPQQFRIQQEVERLNIMPRYMPTKTVLRGKEITLVDAASYLFIYKEIFQNEIYKFKSKSSSPYIIDCGANIGLSTIYFKQLYPEAKIIAFEPDSKVAEAFEHNVRAFDLTGIELVRKGLWNSESTISFLVEGADGGRIAQGESAESQSIQTISLRPYLENKVVDFLKIDIEGAETVVLTDCQDLLHNVENIFVEYHSFEGKEQSLALVLQILQDAGFRVNITAPGLSSLHPFISRNVYLGMDMQVNIYGFRDK